MMENTNEMTIIFDSRPVNEALARVAVASFCTQLNPTLEEISDLKTAVSEAVTNCIIHGYEGEIHKIRVECRLRGQELQVDVTDHGAGIPDIKKAMEPLFTTKADKDRSGMGFTFMEAFMDELQVESDSAHEKDHQEVTMDRTLVLIGRAHQGDKAARDLLFEENTGLIYSVAKRFLGRGVEMEDLFQIGSIGLLKAVDKFDMSYDVKFSTYAVPMIIGEIKRYLRDDGILKVSRSLKENHYRIYQVREALTRRLEREPTTGEMAEEMGISIEELVMTMESGAEVESLHKTIYQGEGTEISLMDKLPEKENRQEKALDRIFLEEILGTLEAKERRLIYMRYFQNMTQMEIAHELGVSQVQVSRMEKRILRSLQESAEKK